MFMGAIEGVRFYMIKTEAGGGCVLSGGRVEGDEGFQG